RHDRALGYFALAAMVLSAAAVFGGLATLCLWSVVGLWQFPDALPSEITARSWMNAAPRSLRTLQTSLLVAALSTTIAAFLALLCLLREDQTGRQMRRGALALIYL